MKKANFIRLSLMLLICFGVTSSLQAQVDSARQKQIVGNDQDSHGCKPSAGYTWSKTLTTCVRIWEAGTKLTPVDTSLNKSISAFVIFSKDKNSAEIYLPGQTESILLEGYTNAENIMVWEKGEWLLKEPMNCKLFRNGKLFFKAN